MHPQKYGGKTDFSRVEPCSCRKEALRQHRLNTLLEKCQLPKGTEDLVFTAFDPYHESLQDAYDACLQMATASSEEAGWVTLMGPPDRGKTLLAVATCRLWLYSGRPAKFAVVPRLLMELRRGFSGDNRYTYEETFDFYCTVPLLVLDDLGMEKQSDWVVEQLDILLNEREQSHLALLVTTNLPMDQLPPRIASRLQRYVPSRVCVIDAPEYRLRRKK